MEIKRAQEKIQLKALVNEIHDSITPGDIVKQTFKTVTASNNVTTGVGKTVIGLAMGFFIKNILFRKTFNPLKIAAGYLLQTGVAVLVANNSDGINTTGKKLLKTIFSKLKR